MKMKEIEANNREGKKDEGKEGTRGDQRREGRKIWRKRRKKTTEMKKKEKERTDTLNQAFEELKKKKKKATKEVNVVEIAVEQRRRREGEHTPVTLAGDSRSTFAIVLQLTYKLSSLFRSLPNIFCSYLVY